MTACKSRRLLFSTSSLSLSCDGSIDVTFCDEESIPETQPHPFRLSESIDDGGDGLDTCDIPLAGTDGGKCTVEDRRRSSTSEDDFVKSWEYQLRHAVVDPDGQPYYYWLAIIATATMYNCAIIIMRLAFLELRDENSYQSTFTVLDYLSDVIYLVDLAIHLRTGFLAEGILVLDPERLQQNYQRKKDFKLAILSLLPLGSVAILISKFTMLIGFGDISNYYIQSPVTRIHRLLKYHMVPRFFEITDSRTSNPNLVRAFKLSLYLWIVIHWIGCFYYILSEYEGFGTNDWVYPNTTDSQRLLRKYILCVYWSMMTLTTIGERPPPETDTEYIFTGLTFLIGVFVFAAVVGNVGDVISNMNAARQDYLARMDQIKFYMNHRNVPTFLQNRVKRWAHYSWTRTQAIDEASLLEMLPQRIRTEIAIHTNLDTLKKVQIFEECEEGLLQELVLKLRPQIYSPRDYICRVGEIGREMYIINHGKVEILVKNPSTGDKMVVATLTSGNYFGEISLLKLDSGQNRRTADVRSVGYSELLCLSRKDLISALVEYPDAKVILEEKALERMQMNKQVRRSSSPDVPLEDDDACSLGANKSSDKPLNNKSRLADVIRSNTFQNLISKRGKEMTELKDVIQELKTFDSQATKLRIQQLSDKCEELMKQLRVRDSELQQAIKRIVELEQTILGPAKRKWMSADRSAIKTIESHLNNVEDVNSTNSLHTKNQQNQNSVEKFQFQETDAVLALARDFTNSKMLKGQQRRVADWNLNPSTRIISADNIASPNNNTGILTDNLVPVISINNADKIEHLNDNSQETSMDNDPETCTDNNPETEADFDLDTALLAVMSLGDPQQLSDYSASNSNSDVDSDDVDL